MGLISCHNINKGRILPYWLFGIRFISYLFWIQKFYIVLREEASASLECFGYSYLVGKV